KLPDTEVARRALADAVGILLRVLYPAVPHITWNLWQALGFDTQFGDLLDAPWPEVDEAALIADEIDLVLQVNGKLRGNLRIANGTEKAQIEQAALAHEAVARFLE